MTQLVTVAQTGAVKEVTFKEGMTVQQAIDASGLSIGRGREVRVNGAAVKDYSTALAANDTILIVGSIRGA